MIAIIDVHYGADHAAAACVLCTEWSAERADAERVRLVSPAADYEPGAFYLRELPAVLAVLSVASPDVRTIVIDGYVWLGTDRKGLGAFVHEQTGLPVIGVAKRPFRGAPHIEVLRGTSARPLLVTAAGVSAGEAAGHIRAMHGPYRIPTLLKRADRLCRDALPPPTPP